MRITHKAWSRERGANDSVSELTLQASLYEDATWLAALYRMTTQYGSTTRGEFWRMLVKYEAEARRKASPQTAKAPPQ